MAVTAHPSRLKTSNPDYIIMACVGVLVALGVVSVYSSSFAVALAAYDNVNYFVIRQAGAAVIGLALMLFLMRFDYRYLRFVSPALMLAAVLGLAGVLVLGSDAPTYYQSARALTRENAKVVLDCLIADAARAIARGKGCAISLWPAARARAARDVRSTGRCS